MHQRLLGDKADFLAQGRDVTLDGFGVDVGENLEVTELATLAAKGDVQVEPQRGEPFGLRKDATFWDTFLRDTFLRHTRRRWKAAQGAEGFGDRLGGPLRIGWVIRDEVASHFGLGSFGRHA